MRFSISNDRSAAFDPETVRTLSDALDDAWRCIDTGDHQL